MSLSFKCFYPIAYLPYTQFKSDLSLILSLSISLTDWLAQWLSIRLPTGSLVDQTSVGSLPKDFKNGSCRDLEQRNQFSVPQQEKNRGRRY